MDADSPAVQPVRGNASETTIMLHQPPRRLSVHPPWFERDTVAIKWSEQRPLAIVADASRLDVGLQRRCRIQQNLACPLVSLFGHVQVVLDPSNSMWPTHARTRALTRQPVIKNVWRRARSRFPLSVDVSMAFKSITACRVVRAGVEFFATVEPLPCSAPGPLPTTQIPWQPAAGTRHAGPTADGLPSLVVPQPRAAPPCRAARGPP